MSQIEKKVVKEAVNHPEHYKRNGLEAIDIIEAMTLGYGFCIGNVIKYIYRAGEKDSSKTVEDLQKAAWYLNRAIEEKKLEVTKED